MGMKARGGGSRATQSDEQDRALTDRIRQTFGPRGDVIEKRMFGGLCFMVGGNMCVGVTKGRMMVRVGKEHYDEAMSQPHARAMDFTGKPMMGFVFVDPEGTKTLAAVLSAVGSAQPDAQLPEAALDKLDEHGFERFLQRALLTALLEAVRTEPTPVDRWEAAAALRLVANLDLKVDLGDELRTLQVRRAETILAKAMPNVRMLDKFAADIAIAATARSRLQALRRLRKRVRKEFARRSKGYGHPAVEAARQDLGRALQRALQKAAADG